MKSIYESFKSENIRLLFDNLNYGTEYIAGAMDCYTDFMSKDIFTSDWARNFEGGRYVIIIYQRHSVYESGNRIYLNENFEYTVDRYSRHKKQCFVLISDTPHEYSVSSWNRPLVTNTVMDEKNSLHTKTFFDEEKAVEEAKKLSLSGEKIVVMKWYADYDQY